MAEDFQAGVCGGSWWMPPGTAFNRSSCSSVIADMKNFGPFCWPRDLVDMKSNSTDNSSDWIQNLLLVQEGLNTFPTSCDDGLEAEDQGFTMDQQQSLDFYPSSLLQSLSNTSFPSSVDDNISSFPPSVLPQFIPASYKEKESCQKLSAKINDEKLWGKSSDELLFKRPRLETPSPLPTFKVRKEKLGDRITALQQLVSPFGKTDTASVLHEAIEYIKLLHDQINILSAPYMKKGATKELQQIDDEVNEREGHEKDLRSLGLCLLPVSSMFPVANEMAVGFLTPSYKLAHLR